MTKFEAFAPAKINLALHVVGQRDDGYHLLESLVVFANIGDRLSAVPADVSTLTVSGPLAAGVPTGPENLVLKAAALAECRAHFTLEKSLPAAAGIGGGSSDAAAALRLCEEMTGRAVAEADMLGLGADVPVCAYGRACVMRGVGEEISPVEGLPGLPALLVNPRVDVPTPQVFKALEDKRNGAMPPVPETATLEGLIAYLAEATRNDLEAPALKLMPQIGEVMDHLAALRGARLTRMSGSGATCFALFGALHEAEAAAADLRRHKPGWWIEPVWLA